MKYSENFNRDWLYYLYLVEEIKPVVYCRNDLNGRTAKECFWAKDTHGKIVACRENELLQKVLEAKERINLTCKMQAEDLLAGIVYPAELEDWHKSAPAWVLRSIFRQAKKLSKDEYVPTYLLNFIQKYTDAERN